MFVECSPHCVDVPAWNWVSLSWAFKHFSLWFDACRCAHSFPLFKDIVGLWLFPWHFRCCCFFVFFPVIAPKRFCFFEFFRRSLEHSFWFMSSCVQIPPRFVSVCSECECGCWCFFALLFCFHFPVLKTPPSFQWDHNVCWLLGPFVYPFPSNTMAKKISRRALP